MWLSPLPGAVPGLLAEVGPEFRLLGWAGALLILIGGGVGAIIWARRRMFAEVVEELSIEDFRKLLDAGDLDPQEFERIRARLEHPGARPAGSPELSQGIQDLQIHTGIRSQPPRLPPSATPPESDPTS